MSTRPTDTRPADVELLEMRRRHLKGVLAIEEKVYPRPWSASLFLSEMSMPSSRSYFVARSRRSVVGYAGFMLTDEDAHVTTIAVDPEKQKRGIGTRLMLTIARAAIARGARHLTLEVRTGNAAARAVYRRFGLAPVGTRPGYYAATNEDALIMWVHDIDSPEYEERLDAIGRSLDADSAP